MGNINEVFAIKNVIIYLLSINLIGFLLMWLDKKKAERGRWRIKEETLLTISLIGGSIGSLLGMYKFHHKTQKPKFFIGIPIMLILQIVIIVLIKLN